jgi:hypothetical protein
VQRAVTSFDTAEKALQDVTGDIAAYILQARLGLAGVSSAESLVQGTTWCQLASP